MNQHEFVAAAYQLVLMTGDLGGKSWEWMKLPRIRFLNILGS